MLFVLLTQESKLKRQSVRYLDNYDKTSNRTSEK